MHLIGVQLIHKHIMISFGFKKKKTFELMFLFLEITFSNTRLFKMKELPLLNGGRRQDPGFPTLGSRAFQYTNQHTKITLKCLFRNYSPNKTYPIQTGKLQCTGRQNIQSRKI